MVYYKLFFSKVYPIVGMKAIDNVIRYASKRFHGYLNVHN